MCVCVCVVIPFILDVRLVDHFSAEYASSMCVCVCVVIPFILDVRLVDQPGSHRRKATKYFSTLLLRCLA